jgi:hypothetical protein
MGPPLRREHRCYHCRPSSPLLGNALDHSLTQPFSISSYWLNVVKLSVQAKGCCHLTAQSSRFPVTQDSWLSRASWLIQPVRFQMEYNTSYNCVSGVHRPSCYNPLGCNSNSAEDYNQWSLLTAFCLSNQSLVHPSSLKVLKIIKNFITFFGPKRHHHISRIQLFQWNCYLCHYVCYYYYHYLPFSPEPSIS